MPVQHIVFNGVKYEPHFMQDSACSHCDARKICDENTNGNGNFCVLCAKLIGLSHCLKRLKPVAKHLFQKGRG